MSTPLTLDELERKILDYRERNGSWPSRRALKIESTLRKLKISYPEVLQRLGGPAPNPTMRERGLSERQRQLAIHLPEIEQRIIEDFFQGVKQQDIAVALNMTQPAVSYRIKRALQRLAFLDTYPFLRMEEIVEPLKQLNFTSQECAALGIICTTTCQSIAARALNWSQGKVRHLHWKAIRLLQGEKRPELQKILTSLEMVRENPTILHVFPSDTEES